MIQTLSEVSASLELVRTLLWNKVHFREVTNIAASPVNICKGIIGPIETSALFLKTNV
jgi:hypothetical protein